MIFLIHHLRFWVLCGAIGLLLVQPSFCLQSSSTTPTQGEQSVAQPQAVSPPEPPKTDTGDTAWLLVSSALVLLMTPGLALFYGGMVRRKNVLGTMMHSFMLVALVSVQWALFGYSLAFHEGSFWGGFQWSFLHGVGAAPASR